MILKQTGDNAGMKNILRELRTPVISAPRETRARKGAMIWVKAMARFSFVRILGKFNACHKKNNGFCVDNDENRDNTGQGGQQGRKQTIKEPLLYRGL